MGLTTTLQNQLTTKIITSQIAYSQHPTTAKSLEKIESNSYMYDKSLNIYISYTKENDEQNIFDNLSLQNFIQKHGLFESVSETMTLLKNFFPKSEIKFELYTDHEWDKETLFIYVLTDLPIRESSKIMISMFKHLKALKNRAFCKYVAIVDKRK